jgi:predicted DNA-binding transcriptional regulator YafY
MESTADRRMRLIEVLCDRRSDTYENLATEFGVSKKTIQRDIIVLSCTHPIYTQVGGRNTGGVYVADGYYIGRKYLKPKQQDALQRAIDNASDEDREILLSIYKEFSLKKQGGKR